MSAVVSQNNIQFSNDFFSFVRAIGESQSKQEEDRIVMRELTHLRSLLKNNDISNLKMREYVIRSLYVEMLGYNAPFMYIHAIKLAHDGSIINKKIGYLMCSLCLNKNSELILLLINTVQKDLNSSNFLHVSAALTCVSYLLTVELIQVILPTVLNLLCNHRHEIIRKKACMVLYGIYLIDPDLFKDDLIAKIRKTVLDPDPSVMGASLHFVHELSLKNSGTFGDMVPAFVSILKQLSDFQLSSDYEYHKVPAPWIQIKLLSLLSTLGNDNKNVSEFIQKILVNIILKSECYGNIGYAILYEAIKAATSIYPSTCLLEHATNAISKFISYENHNLKYIGISGLGFIVRIHPSIASGKDHQITVLDCLESSDDTLKKKTLDLLFYISNAANVKAIVDKLLHHLQLASESDFRKAIVFKICRLIDNFISDELWYVGTINNLLRSGRDYVPKETLYNILRLMQEGPTSNSIEDNIFRTKVVNLYLKLFEDADYLPNSLIQIGVWILGEFGYLSNLKPYQNSDNIITLITKCISWKKVNSYTRCWIFSAIFKLCILKSLNLINLDLTKNQKDVCSNKVLGKTYNSIFMTRENFEKYAGSTCTLMYQFTAEFLNIFKNFDNDLSSSWPALLRFFFCNHISEDFSIDENLTFLDDYVSIQNKNKQSKHFSTKNEEVDPVKHGNNSLFENSLIENRYENDVAFSRSCLKSNYHSSAHQDLAKSEHVPWSKLIGDDISLKINGIDKWGPHGYSNFTLENQISKNAENLELDFLKKKKKLEIEADRLFKGVPTNVDNSQSLTINNHNDETLHTCYEELFVVNSFSNGVDISDAEASSISLTTNNSFNSSIHPHNSVEDNFVESKDTNIGIFWKPYPTTPQKTEMKCFLVQAIDKEAIFAVVIDESNQDTSVLFHIKMSPLNRLHVILKGNHFK